VLQGCPPKAGPITAVDQVHVFLYKRTKLCLFARYFVCSTYIRTWFIEQGGTTKSLSSVGRRGVLRFGTRLLNSEQNHLHNSVCFSSWIWSLYLHCCTLCENSSAFASNFASRPTKMYDAQNHRERELAPRRSQVQPQMQMEQRMCTAVCH